MSLYLYSQLKDYLLIKSDEIVQLENTETPRSALINFYQSPMMTRECVQQLKQHIFINTTIIAIQFP